MAAADTDTGTRRAFVGLLAAAAATGVAAGIGGVLLTWLLHAVQHTAFGYTELTFLYGVEQASPARRVVVMTIGGLVVGLGWWALHRWTRSRVPAEREMLDPDRPMPMGTTVTDAGLQIVAVGFGASLGREGAPRQVGAALAGWIGHRMRLTPAHRRTVIACGAGAGLAAVYNVPLGGAVFALEILLGSLALTDLLAVLVATAVATAVAWPFIGDLSTYQVPPQVVHPALLAGAVVIGLLAGPVGRLFLQVTSWARTLSPTGWRLPVTTTLVFAAVGAVAIPFPELLGNGKGPAQLALTGTLSLLALIGLTALKPLTTAACLASGARGGLLTPSVATGATLGAAFGTAWSLLWPGSSLAGFAIVGAAALLAVTQRAPLCAIVLALEFTHSGVDIAVPVVVAVVLAVGTDRLLYPGH
jgi:H+/Cl- antiporter ClcA